MTTLTNPLLPNDFIYAIAGDSPALFAAAASGLYRSTDSGQTWQLATASLNLPGPVPATSLALSPDFEHDRAIFGGMAGGILASADAGLTWALAQTPPPPPTVTALVISPNYVEDGVILAGTMEDGILRSTDRGRRWNPWNFGLLDLSIFCLAISPNFKGDECILAGAETGIFRSSNGGRAWREVELPGGYQTVLSLAISPGFAANGLAYAGTEEQGVLVSRDHGATWDALPAEPLDGPVNGLTADQQSSLLALCGGKAYLSRDGGQRWSALWPELAGSEISTVYAPEGLGEGQHMWVGLIGGKVERKVMNEE